jgi:hypothetical protein
MRKSITKKATKKTTKVKTIGGMAKEGKLPPDLLLPVTVQAMDDMVKKAVMNGWEGAEEHLKGEGRSFICDMLLPDGTRFGDIMASYPDGDCASIDELVELLALDVDAKELAQRKDAA